MMAALMFDEADVLRREQDAQLAVREGGVRGVRADDAARRVLRLLEARVPEDLVLVGDGHGDGGGGRQQQPADLLGGRTIHALVHAGQRLARQLQHGVRLTRAHRIGIHDEADDHHDGQREHHARAHHDGQVAVRHRDGPQQHEARKRRHREHEHLKHISSVKKRGSADFESLVSSRMVPPASLNRAQAARLGPSAQYTEFVEHKYDGGHNQEAAEDEAQGQLGNHAHEARADDRAGDGPHDDGDARRVVDVA